MTFIGEATPMGTSLELSGQGIDWHMSIRRVDGKSDPRFFECNKKSVSAAEVAQFFPQWRELAWRNVANSMFSHSKSHAQNSSYQITLSAARNSSLSPADVVDAFKDFMAASET